MINNIVFSIFYNSTPWFEFNENNFYPFCIVQLLNKNFVHYIIFKVKFCSKKYIFILPFIRNLLLIKIYK